MSVQLDQSGAPLTGVWEELESAVQNDNLAVATEKCRALIAQATDREELIRVMKFLVRLRTSVRKKGFEQPGRHDLFKLLNIYVVQLTSSTAKSSAGKLSSRFEEKNRASGHCRKALGHRSFASARG